MGGDFQDALLKIVIESIPCIFLVQSAIGLKVFSHSFNSVSWFLSTLFCIYILSPIIMLILTRKPCSKKKLIKKMRKPLSKKLKNYICNSNSDVYKNR